MNKSLEADPGSLGIHMQDYYVPIQQGHTKPQIVRFLILEHTCTGANVAGVDGREAK